MRFNSKYSLVQLLYSIMDKMVVYWSEYAKYKGWKSYPCYQVDYVWGYLQIINRNVCQYLI